MSNFLQNNLARIVGKRVELDSPREAHDDPRQDRDDPFGSPDAPRGSMHRVLINSRWRVYRKLGSGSFGSVFMAEDADTGERVAVKLEIYSSKVLHYEAKIYQLLNHGCRSIPRIHWYGQVNGNACMVLDLLGDSLETIKERMPFGRIKERDALLLGIYAIDAIAFLHHKNFVHRDIKADNFVMGTNARQKICYLIDYGLAKQYRDPKTKRHIPFRDDKSLTGTPRFASIANHLGMEQSRRDDLESLAYVLVYLIEGQLPWQNIVVPGHIKDSKRYKNQRIMEIKQSTSVDTLCRNVPAPVYDLLVEARRLAFDERPNYAGLTESFARWLAEPDGSIRFNFSWIE